MKTLREYIDQLDEISRRDALKYAGAAALGGAVGYYKGAEGQVDKNTAYDLGFLWGFTAAAQETLRGQKFGRTRELLDSMGAQATDLMRRVGSDIQKNSWYQSGFNAGVKHFHSRAAHSDNNEALATMFDTLLDRARESSYGQPQKIFKEEELEETTQEEDPIDRINRLFRDK